MANIVGVFNSKADAMGAISELMNTGFRKDRLSLIVSDRSGNSMLVAPSDNAEERTAKGGAAGALFGAALGALIASFTAIGTITIPIAGLFIAGPIVAIIAGVGLGAIVGGLSGVSISAGSAENEAARYQRDINNGKAVVIIHTTGGDSAKTARLVLNNNDATLKVV